MKKEDKIGWYNSFKERFEEEPLFLIKYCSEEKHAIDVSNGKIYVNNARFFVDLEKGSGIKGTGDKREMIADIPEGYMIQIRSETTEKPIEFLINKNVQVAITLNRDLDTTIYCTSAVKIPDINKVEINETKDKISFKFTVRLDDMDISVYKYCTIIDSHKFYSSLNDFFSPLNIRWFGNKIAYTNDVSERFEVMKKFDNAKRYFFKDSYFSSQNEFRIAIEMNMPSDNFIDLNSSIGFVSETGVDIELFVEALKNSD
ncbi:hypothetical protein IY230_02175 [Acholeplasma laidlawii]|uniref:hypothetical protein n=1 Tax=Acholeplasma laidlawii TaxID=2148 RepID=UPI0018C3397E|nr:hypothetical protein [Acholeplasma laidlawii]MBG0762419.1 hypothetical protein [Acholeplasma laidlawii]